MTTGRINQVTIVARSTPPGTLRTGPNYTLDGAAPNGPAQRAWNGQAHQYGVPSRSRPTIHLPPLSFPQDGPTTTLIRAHESWSSGCVMRPARGGYRSLSHAAKDSGYQRQLTPKNVLGQGSHRPMIHRLQRCLPS